MSLEFFVATDAEVARLNDWAELFDLVSRYGIIASGAENFKDFKLLSNFFLQGEEYFPKKIIKTIQEHIEDETYRFGIYKLERNFIENVAQIDKAKLDNLDSIEYWQSRGYYEQGIWNCVYGVHNLCNYAIRDGKNLYILEETE